jgi:hypothetical protein
MTRDADFLHLQQSPFTTISSRLIKHLFISCKSVHCTEIANNGSRQSTKYRKDGNLHYKIVFFLLLAIDGFFFAKCFVFHNVIFFFGGGGFLRVVKFNISFRFAKF